MRFSPKPKVLAIMPGIIPSTELWVIKPLLGLERNGMINTRITLEWLAREKDLDWADVVVFCRNQEPVYAHWLEICNARGLPFIYDLDDNFFLIPEDYDFKTGFNSEQIDMVRQYLCDASLVRVYSERMVHVVKPWNTSVQLVDSTLDWELIQAPSRDSQRVRLVYATSRVNDRLAALFMPALRRFLREYSDQVEMHFWGYNPPEMRSFSNVFFKPLILNYNRYLREFSRTGFDIGLAPLLDDEFHNSKANTKFREYGASQVAGVYSNAELFRNCVKSQRTGLLVENTEESWYQALKQLVENPTLRRQIQVAALNEVRANYSEEHFEEVWLDQILNLKHLDSMDRASGIYPLQENKELAQHQTDGIDITSASSTSLKAQFHFQITKAFDMLRRKNLSVFFQRTWMKLEQVWLLGRIRWFKRL